MNAKAYTGGLDFNITNLPEYNDFTIQENYNYLKQYDSITYRAIKVIADTLITFPYKLYERKAKGHVEITDNDMLKDLNRFNSFQTLQDARKITFTHKRLTGNAYWLIRKAENPGNKYEFYILDPTRVGVIAGKSGLPTKYTYLDRQGKKKEFSPEDIIVFQETNPQNPVKGYSIIDASRYAHFTHEMIRKSQLNQFGNGFPKGILVYGKSDGQPATKTSRNNLQRLREWFSQRFSGVRNHGKTPVLDQDVKWVQIGQNNKELDYGNSVDSVRDEILAIQGVPRPLLGFPDSTYSNAKEMQRVFQANTIRPELMSEEGVLNEQLLPKYYGENSRQAQNLFFMFDDPVEPDKAEMSSVMIEAWKSGAISKAQINEYLGFEVVDGDENVYATSSEEATNNIVEEVRSLRKEVKSIPDLQEKKQMQRDRLKSFYLVKNIQQEKKLVESIEGFFIEQGLRITKDAVRQQGQKVLKTFNTQDEVEITVQTFSPVFMQQAKFWNDIANGIVDDPRKLSESQKRFIEQNTKYFAQEINKVTREKLNNVIATGIEAGSTEIEIGKEVANVFNGYIDGAKNVETLKALDMYVDTIEVTVEGNVVKGSANRYNKMYEIISQSKTLSDEQRQEALKALLGMTKDADDALAETVGGLLERFGVEEFQEISTRRAVTIARTETNKIKNKINRIRYAENESVDEMEWLTAQDSDVREAHSSADGQRVPKGAKFRVGGEWLEAPGQGNIASNNINCRCTILPIVNV